MLETKNKEEKYTVPKLKIGLKFRHKAKPQWVYQISEVDENDVIISWLVGDVINSTLYERSEVNKYFENGIWRQVSSETSIIHKD